jgi:hypothetical protein
MLYKQLIEKPDRSFGHTGLIEIDDTEYLHQAINLGIDGVEFIDDYDAFFLQDTKAGVEIAFFITDNVSPLVKYILYFLLKCDVVLYHNSVKIQ